METFKIFLEYAFPISIILIMVFAKVIYKKNNKKVKQVWYGSGFLLLLSVVNFAVEGTNLLDIILVIYGAFFIYTIVAVFVVNVFGTIATKRRPIKDKKLEAELLLKFKKIPEAERKSKTDNDKKLHLEKDKYYYYTWELVITYTERKKQNTKTQIYNLLLLIFVITISISFIYPVLATWFSIDPSSKDVFLGIFAFLGAYVFSPFFPDFYYTISFAKG